MVEKLTTPCGYIAYYINEKELTALNDVNCFGNICDECNKYISTGFYVPVLNHTMCKTCFASWCSLSHYYEDDIEFEHLNVKWFERWCNYLSIKLQEGKI